MIINMCLGSFNILKFELEDYFIVFNQVSVFQRKVNVCTLDALRKVIAKSYTPTPFTIVMENIYNLNEWLEPFIYPMTYHSQPHACSSKKTAGRNDLNKPRQPTEKGSLIVLDGVPTKTPSVSRPENE